MNYKSDTMLCTSCGKIIVGFQHHNYICYHCFTIKIAKEYGNRKKYTDGIIEAVDHMGNVYKNVPKKVKHNNERQFELDLHKILKEI